MAIGRKIGAWIGYWIGQTIPGLPDIIVSSTASLTPRRSTSSNLADLTVYGGAVRGAFATLANTTTYTGPRRASENR